MDPVLEARINNFIDYVTNTAEELDQDSQKFRREILTHLSRINSTLSAIDRNLVLLEMKK